MQMSDIFRHSCGLNIHPLRTGQDCTTLWDYLEGLSPGSQLGAKTPESAMTKLTQMVQSPPGTFWYVFYMSDIGSVENCWTTRNDAN